MTVEARRTSSNAIGEPTPSYSSSHVKGKISRPLPNENDSMQTHHDASNANVISYDFSIVISFFKTVLNGNRKLWLYACWFLSKIGFMNSQEAGKMLPMSWKQEKNRIRLIFSSATPYEKLECFTDTLPLWQQPGVKAFYIELFSQQDEEILVALAKRVRDELYPSRSKYRVSVGGIQRKLAERFFTAFSQNASERTASDEAWIKVYKEFMLEFSECALEKD